MLGFINLNKPSGWTSHDCVAKVRRLLNIKRVGHGGTLDPAATGVLPIAVGKATRLLPYLAKNKAYQAKIRFGVLTTTDDLEGEVRQTQSARQVTLAQIEAILPQFLGQIQQIPPAYSAIQQGGKRLYELARKGEKVEVPQRTVQVDQIEILGWYPGEFAELEIAIACGSGTYIRAIARDLGNTLNVGGTLASLMRTSSCGMQLNESLTLEEIEYQCQQEIFSLMAADLPLKHLGSISLSESQAKHWCQGQAIAGDNSSLTIANPQSPVRIYQENGQFLGMGEWVITSANLWLIPKLVLV